MIVDLVDVTHLTSKEITLLAEIQAEAYPDPTEIENERKLPQAQSYQVSVRGVPTPLAQRCLDNEERRNPHRFHHAKSK